MKVLIWFTLLFMVAELWVIADHLQNHFLMVACEQYKMCDKYYLRIKERYNKTGKMLIDYTEEKKDVKRN